MADEGVSQPALVELHKRPSQVVLTDLYWGVSQAAVWSYEQGFLTLDGLIVRTTLVVSVR